MLRNLVIYGGIYHPFAEAAQALADSLTTRGVESELTDDVEGALTRLADFDLLTVYALRWRMLDDPKYQPFRAEFAMSLSTAGRAALEAFMARGGALLALHTASICFDDWPGWGEILGARWRWGRSFHPPQQTVQVQVDVTGHPICAGIADFVVEDEIFHDLEPTAALQPLLSARATPASNPQPLFWAREHGGGRVVYDALGHTAESIRQPAHCRMLQQAVEWLCAAPRARP